MEGIPINILGKGKITCPVGTECIESIQKNIIASNSDHLSIAIVGFLTLIVLTLIISAVKLTQWIRKRHYSPFS